MDRTVEVQAEYLLIFSKNIDQNIKQSKQLLDKVFSEKWLDSWDNTQKIIAGKSRI